MRFAILNSALAFLLVASSVRGDATLPPKSPLHHNLSVRIEPTRGSMTVSDIMTIPIDRIEDGRVKLVTAGFITDIQPQLVSGARALSTTSRTNRNRIEWDLEFASIAPYAEEIVITVEYRVTAPSSPLLAIRPEGSLAGSIGNPWYPQLSYPAQDVGILTIQVPPGERVIATGIPASTTEQEAAGLFIFQNPVPTKFAYAAGRYQRHIAADGSFSIFALRERPTTAMWLERTSAAIRTLVEIYGPLPYGAPSLVEVDFPSFISGVSERGFILADDQDFDSYSLLYWAHEFAHQWWGLAIRPEDQSPGMSLFTEALSEFSGLQVIEAIEGAAAITDIRTGRSSPATRSPIERFGEVAEKGEDFSLREQDPGDDASAAMHRLSTAKGATVLTMLADIVGKELVHTALKAVISRSTGGFSTWRNVEEEINRTTGNDYGWFFEQWLGRPGIAELGLEWRTAAEGKQAHGTISQPSIIYRMPVEVELIGTNGESKTELIWLEERHTPFEISAEFQIRRIILDPRYRLFRRPLASDLRRVVPSS